MFRRLVITCILTTLAIMGSATTSSATTLRDLQLPGVNIAAQAVGRAASLLYGIPGVFIGANAACGAANLLRFFLRQKSVHGRPGRPIVRHFGPTFEQVTANARNFLAPHPPDSPGHAIGW
ncbi:hypothetical protein [Acrocarpospora sp. B8E8]|uniref:hypothetical protein n=1 Tax=Acrocarpospora sp. B8E8 TaxID=3153572 RepID=UPI00325E1DA6